MHWGPVLVPQLAEDVEPVILADDLVVVVLHVCLAAVDPVPAFVVISARVRPPKPGWRTRRLLHSLERFVVDKPAVLMDGTYRCARNYRRKRPSRAPSMWPATMMVPLAVAVPHSGGQTSLASVAAVASVC
jgi:hypothetical protein